jgi:polysaccharide export outer membrane protein
VKHLSHSLSIPWALACVTLAACAGTRCPAPPAALTLAAPPAVEPYRLQVGDQLAVRFYFNPELNDTLVVRPDGMISLQLIGDVEAAGRTPLALAAAITQRYTAELANPKVTVIVQQFGSRVYVGGEVGKQGVVPLSGGLTLFQAIQEAGGFLTTAHRKQVILIRKGPDARPVGYAIDVRPIASGERPEQDVFLQPYDVVFVPMSRIANMDLFVKQYIRDLLPVMPGFAVAPF